jgi:hypothetical protein
VYCNNRYVLRNPSIADLAQCLDVHWLSKLFEFVGNVGLFSLRVVADSLTPPFAFAQLSRRLTEVGNKSLALIVVSRFARLFELVKDGCTLADMSDHQSFEKHFWS